MPRAISPGPAGLKFWRAPGLAADSTAADNNLPASIGDQFNPWGPKRPVQDWVCGVSPSLIALAIPPDTTNLPAGIADSFYPWGPRRGNPYSTWFSALHIPQPITLIAADGSYTLTGASAAQAFGQAAAAGSYALTGSAAGQAFGYATGSGSYALTGSAAPLAFRITSQYLVGGYEITGSDAGLALGFSAGSGSYTITGTDVGLVIPGGLPAAAGSYTLTGSDAALTVSGGAVDYLPAGMTGGYVPWRRPHPVNLRTSTGRPLAAAPSEPVVLTAAGGSYVISGTAATLTSPDTTNLPAGATVWFYPWRRPHPVSLLTGISRVTVAGPVTLTADAGSYALTGSAAALVATSADNLPAGAVNWFNPWGRRFPINLRTSTGRPLAQGPIRLTAAAGDYTLTGTSAALTVSGNIVLSAAAGSYAITGTSAGQALGLSANSGAYSVSGTAAVLARGYAAGAGAYAIVGTDAQFALVGNITFACGAGSYTLTGSSITISPPEQLGGTGGGGGGIIRRRRSLFRRKKHWREELRELIQEVIDEQAAEPIPALKLASKPLGPRTPTVSRQAREARQLEELLKSIETEKLPPPELVDLLSTTSQLQISRTRISSPPITSPYDDDEDAVALLLAVLL